MNKLRTVVLVGFLAASGLQAQAKRQPQFEQYPAPTTFKGKPVRAKIVGRRAKLFRTVITDGASQGPNFAGYYTVVMWGCGASCQMLAIVDARTGTVYIPGGLLQVESSPWAGVDPLAEEESIQFRKDSRLLVLVGGGYFGNKARRKGKYFYEWRGDRLRLISAVQRHYY
jgi:hypothetical protein